MILITLFIYSFFKIRFVAAAGLEPAVYPETIFFMWLINYEKRIFCVFLSAMPPWEKCPNVSHDGKDLIINQ